MGHGETVNPRNLLCRNHRTCCSKVQASKQQNQAEPSTIFTHLAFDRRRDLELAMMNFSPQLIFHSCRPDRSCAVLLHITVGLVYWREFGKQTANNDRESSANSRALCADLDSMRLGGWKTTATRTGVPLSIAFWFALASMVWTVSLALGRACLGGRCWILALAASLHRGFAPLYVVMVGVNACCMARFLLCNQAIVP